MESKTKFRECIVYYEELTFVVEIVHPICITKKKNTVKYIILFHNQKLIHIILKKKYFT